MDALIHGLRDGEWSQQLCAQADFLTAQSLSIK